MAAKKAKPKVARVLWDACVILEAIQGQDKSRYALIKPLLQRAEAGQLLIVVSETTRGEVSHLGDLRDQGVDVAKQEALIADWFENPYIVRRQVHKGISDLGAKIGAQHGIKRVGDRFIVATALFDGIDTIHTFDGDLLKLNGKIGTPPLRITEPGEDDIGGLFAQEQIDGEEAQD